MDLTEIIAEGERLLGCFRLQNYNQVYSIEPDECENYERWLFCALSYVETYRPDTSQIAFFKNAVDYQYEYETYDRGSLKTLVNVLKGFEAVGRNEKQNIDVVLDTLFNRFDIFAKQLLRRYDDRPTIKIGDEYDVQDLLEAVLRLHFEDVRPEEWCPSYAGSSKRMDFLLNEEKIAVEVKKTRKGLGDKELGEQLLIDIGNYKQHKNCDALYCFVYDPDGKVRNPRGLEKDLEKLDKEFKVRVYIRPN